MALPCPLKNESTEPQLMFCVKTDAISPSTNKPSVKRVKKSKSRELRAGILYIGCDCERRYGLQDDCLRGDCHGAPPCLVKPDPICGPSEFAGGKHLMKKLEDRKNAALNNAASGTPGYECFPVSLKVCSAETQLFCGAVGMNGTPMSNPANVTSEPNLIGMLYGGDEIGALVFDPGHHSLRVGYAQEDTPKADIPAVVGVAPDETHKIEPESKPDDTNISSTPSSWKYYIDTTFLHTPRPNMELHSYMKDGMIDNWDLFEKIIDYSYEKIIQSESQYHPVLFSECPWNLRQRREKLTEIMFEKYKVPAFFLVKNAALAAFANGRATALVIDSGATHTSAVPVLDGYVITNALVKSPLGGDYLILKAREMLEHMGIDLTPSSLIANKEVVRDKDKPKFTKKKLTFQPTNTWMTYMIKKTVQDFQQSVLQVSETPFDERIAAGYPTIQHEFPTGYHQDFGSERFKLAEALFDHAMLGAGYIAATSAGMCDVDIRPALYSSVVLTGGNSLVQGFSERLSRDLSSRTPGSLRLKMIAANGTVERRFGSWVGGSILASIGTFQQMWMSMQEYQEAGKAQIDRKCP